MTAVFALVGAGLVTWILRISFITLIPPERLPEIVRRALHNVGPAALAALVVTGLAHGGGPAALVQPSPHLLAALVAGVVAWRTRNIAFTAGSALVALWALTAL
jgi:branched-subunit amino acid transport protein